MPKSAPDSSTPHGDPAASVDPNIVSVPSERRGSASADDALDIVELVSVIWRERWLALAVAAALAVASVLYAVLLTPWYRAEVILVPAEARSASQISSQLGGLAALAGVSVGGGESTEAIATLRSRGFIREFIVDLDLMPILFEADWDQSRGEWISSNPEDWPDVRDGVRLFLEDVLRVSEARDSALVTLAIEWPDANLAAEWAMALVTRLNTRLRERALEQAEANVAYLQSELAQTNVVTLQQSIGRLLESELQKLMLARGNDEFAFRVIDPAEVPNMPARPRRALIVALGLVLGLAFGIFAAFLKHMVRVRGGALSIPRRLR